MVTKKGPLAGLRVLEIEGLGPAPFCGMMLADMGAEVISVTRKSGSSTRPEAISERGKQSIALNLKHPEGVALVLRLCADMDVLIEGFRPGVAERLGIGPEDCMSRNKKLVYGRMTGWGQDGPLSRAAGHDINYIALSGALHGMGDGDRPPRPPLNLVGDFGGGGMFLAFGVMCAVYEAQQSGEGQVIDVSMVEGAASLMHMMYAFYADGRWQDTRDSNPLDGAAHFYSTYETQDGKYISLGPIEPQFYQQMREKLDLTDAEFDNQGDRGSWPQLKSRVAAIVKTKTRDEWVDLLEGGDTCFAPVLSMLEAPEHPHNQYRKSFFTRDGVLQPAPAPKFSRSQPPLPEAPAMAGEDTEVTLLKLGYSREQIAELRKSDVIT